MRIAVITRHAVSNYGSLLQAIATQYVIEQMGHTCEIIDYIRDDESYRKREITLLKRKPGWYNNPLKRSIYLMLRQPESIIAGKKFEKAQKRYLKLSKRYSTYEQLEEDTPMADIYMTGSDQVWGAVENGTYDAAYCLAFVHDKTKVAYAASFGHTENTDYLKDYYYQNLSKYNYITVREDSAISMLKDIGLSGKQVLDPTLLPEENFWDRFMEPIFEKKYLLVYQLGNNKTLNEYAKKVAKKKNFKLIRVSPTLHQVFRGGKLIFLPSIGEYLSLIKNAECLITDSFHGTAFAINFCTPFIEVLPTNGTDSRNISILKLTGLTERILNDPDNLNIINERIDFEKVRGIISNERNKSLKILNDMIGL